MARGVDVDTAIRNGVTPRRGRLGRFARHGHSVATFRAAERVSVATFHSPNTHESLESRLLLVGCRKRTPQLSSEERSTN